MIKMKTITVILGALLVLCSLGLGTNERRKENHQPSARQQH
jgi:preprotein translocase subunit SecG